MIGKTIGHYQILSQLGSGGMGVVYEAEDTTLGRRVALKFLPDEYSQNAASLERFLREARAASALNHPNICTIYAAEQFDNTWLIAMELLEGATLGQLIGDRSLTLDRILEIGIQVSDALDVAHTHGIVHRDIKPANIFVSKKGVVKVLDFGLAKLAVDRHAMAQTIGATAAEPPSFLTSPGMAVGTAAYMSPEQARGEDLDGRSDLFSFGGVLYEMCTGKVPFEGATSAVIFAGILDRDPVPPDQLNRQLPPKLVEIICKSLEKDRDLRYQTAAELRGDFKRLRRDTSGRSGLSGSASTEATAAFPATAAHRTSTAATTAGTPQVATTPPSSASILIGEAKRHKFGVIFTLVVLLAAMGGGGWALWSQFHRHTGSRATQPMSIERLTNSGKIEGSANISPDGKYVVYEMTENGKSSLWLRQIATSSAVKLVPDSDVGYGPTTFSPDGNYVYYTWSPQSEPNSALYVVPTLGGTPRKVLSNISGPVSFSPDGSQFAFIREVPGQGLSTIMIANTADGSIARTLISSKIGERWFGNFGVSWSHDGKLIATPILGTGQDGYYEGIGIVDMTGKLTPLVAKLPGQTGRMAWLNDGSAIVFNANQRVGDPNRQIYLVTYPGGEISRITNDPNTYGTVSFGLTADDSTLVTVQTTMTSNLWVGDGNGSNAKQVTQDAVVATNGLSAAGKKMVYTSNGNVWLMDEDGGTPVQINPTRDYAESPQISPDQKYVAYMDLHDNKPNIWASNADGTNPHQLTFGNADIQPTFGTDDTVYFMQFAEGHINLYRVPVGGGTPVKISDLLAQNPQASYKGDRLLVSYFDNATGASREGILDIKTGQITNNFRLPETGSNAGWMPNDRGIAYVNSVNNVDNLWEMDLNGEHPQQLTHYTEGRIFNYAWFGDGKLVVAKGSFSSDAILLRNFR